MTTYVIIAIIEAVTVGVIAWGTGWIIWHRLREWRKRRHRDPESN